MIVMIITLMIEISDITTSILIIHNKKSDNGNEQEAIMQ